MEKSLFDPYEASDQILKENGIDPKEEQIKKQEELKKKKSPFTEQERLDAIEKSGFKVYSKEQFGELIFKNYQSEEYQEEYNQYFSNIHFVDNPQSARDVVDDNIFNERANTKTEILCLQLDDKIIGVCYLKADYEDNSIMELRFLSIHDHYKNAGGSKKLMKNVFEYCVNNGITLKFSTFTNDGQDFLRKYSFVLAKQYKDKIGYKTIFSVVKSKIDSDKDVFYEEFTSGDKKYIATFKTGKYSGEFIDLEEQKN